MSDIIECGQIEKVALLFIISSYLAQIYHHQIGDPISPEEASEEIRYQLKVLVSQIADLFQAQSDQTRLSSQPPESPT